MTTIRFNTPISSSPISSPNTAQVARVPNGIDPRRIRVALTPDERAALEWRAGREGHTLSAQARIFIVRGMLFDEALCTGALGPFQTAPHGGRSTPAAAAPDEEATPASQFLADLEQRLRTAFAGPRRPALQQAAGWTDSQVMRFLCGDKGVTIDRIGSLLRALHDVAAKGCAADGADRTNGAEPQGRAGHCRCGCRRDQDAAGSIREAGR